MASSSEGGSNTVLYVVLGVVLIAVVGVCCLAGGIAFAFMRARSAAEEALDEERALQRAEERDLRNLLDEERDEAAQRSVGTFADVSLQPPVSLGLNPTPTSDRRARHIEATVTRADGAIGVSVGDHCSFDVQVLDRSRPPGFWCRTFAECNGVRLFGEQLPRPTGYLPCEVYDAPLGVAGEDLEPTVSADNGDPLFQIDTRTMSFMAADNEHGRLGTAYRVVARIDSVTAR